MEKSMIQDLDAMRISLGYKNTFTTSFHDGGYELKKSKISNLPSYKKSDLSPKLPFVVVFQTMEIERLSEQIEALRISLKDSERQAFNCQSYEIQIRELTDQCHEYDVELLEYKEETQKLNAISQKLYDELEEWRQKYQNYDPLIEAKYASKTQQCQNLQIQLGKWKDRYRALETSRDKEMEDLKLAMQSQRKSVLDREIRELNLKFQTERAYLNGQIRKMQQAQDDRENQLTKAKFEAEALKIEMEGTLDASRKLKQAENKQNKLAEELVRLNEIVRRKQQEISRNAANQEYLKELIKSLQRQKFNHQNQAIKVPQLENAIKQWIVKFSRLENENNENSQLLQKVPVLQRDLQNSVIENEKLGEIIRGKMQQINDANAKIGKYKLLYEQSKKSQEKVPLLERRINEMGYEAERLNTILKKRLIEIQQGKNRIFSLEKELKLCEQIGNQKRRVEQQLRKQTKQVEGHRKQIKQLQKQLKKIPEIEEVLRDQRRAREEYIREVDRLNKIVKDKSEENETCYEKIQHLQSKVAQFSNIEDELNAYKSQASRMMQEIDGMNDKIRQKCSMLDEIGTAVEALQEHVSEYKKMEQKLVECIDNTEQITQQLNETKSELQKNEQNLLKCESQISQAKNTIIDISNDRDILNRNLQIKNQQLTQAEAEINELLAELQSLKQVERCYHALQEEMRQAQTRLRQLEDLLARQRAINNQLEYKVQTAVNQIERMKTNGYFPEGFRVKFDKLKTNSLEKQKQLQNIIRKQRAMERCAQEIQGMVAMIFSTLQTKNGEWLEINNKIQNSVTHIHTISQLQNQNSNLRTENLELESQIKILNLEILEMQVRKSANNTINATTPTSSVTSWSFNTVPSKKAIDSVVEEQTESRMLTFSNNKRILSSTANTMNINNTNLQSRLKLDEGKTSSRILLNNPSVNLEAGRQFNQNPSAASINSSRGISPSLMNSYFPSPVSKLGSTSKESTQTYFAMKTSKTSSVRQPYTPLSSYRA